MLVVFDLEGTLTENEFWDSFGQTRGTAAAAMSGKVDFRTVMLERFKAVAGMPAVDFKAAGDGLKLREGARELVDSLKALGFEVAIVSGGFDFFTRRIAGELGVAWWRANALVEEGGLATGFREPLVDAAAKRQFVESLQGELGVARSETVVVGDGANDLQMMALGFGVAFNAKPVVREAAGVAVDGGLEDLLPCFRRRAAEVAARPRVLVAGNVERAPFAASGFNVVFGKGLSKGELAARVKGFDALVYRGTERIDGSVMGGRLKLVVRPGVGLDGIDLEAAERKGIRVVNTPCASTVTVAEHCVALILCALRNIPQSHAALARGEWLKEKFCGVELCGRTVGIVGLGRIGIAVARRLKAFGVKLVAFDPYVDESVFVGEGVERMPSLEALLSSCDIVTLHVPLTRETRGMIDCKSIALMRRHAVFVNTSRGKVVVEVDLEAALREGRIAAAALDVFESEPLAAGRFAGLDNVVLTPHLGGSTHEALERISCECVQRIGEWWDCRETAVASEGVAAVGSGSVAAVVGGRRS